MRINQRAKPGQGKLFYGMSAKQLEQIKALRADTELGLQAHAVQLYKFTELYVSRARDLAKENQKDSARDWFRFFTNSQICTILESFSNVGHLSKLRQSLKDLGTECHPLDVPTFTTDLQAIRHAVAEILSHVEQKSHPDETVSRFNPCRTVYRSHGPIAPR